MLQIGNVGGEDVDGEEEMVEFPASAPSDGEEGHRGVRNSHLDPEKICCYCKSSAYFSEKAALSLRAGNKNA